MAIYLYNIIIIFILGYFLLKLYKGKITKKIFFTIITLQMSLIAGLRGYNVGWDTRNYIIYFLGSADHSIYYILTNDLGTEKGYFLLQNIISRVSNNPTVSFLIIATFYCVSVGLWVYKNSKYPIISYIFFISVGFYTFSMTALRQTLAVGIILFSYDFIKKRKFTSFLLIVLLASTFHFSALAFLPFYFLAYLKINTFSIVLMLSTIPVAFFFRNELFILLNMLSPYEYSFFETEGPVTLYVLMILVFIGGVIQKSNILKTSKDNAIYINAVYISIIVSVVAFIHPATLRLAYYFMFYMILFIPEIIYSISNKGIRRFTFYIVLIVFLFLYIRKLNPSSPFLPYVFYWQ